MEFVHLPVLSEQTIKALSPHSGGVYIDGTVGGGGHSSLILQASDPDGFLLGIDRDDEALSAAEQKLAPFSGRFLLRKGNFAGMAEIAAAAQIEAVDGILLDIGVSSHQLDDPERGFSYMADAALDMRMDQTQGITAADLLASVSEEELTRILYQYGEEKWAARIAKFVINERSVRPIRTTAQLTEIIKKAVPKDARDKDQHPAKRSFQALRIAVNDELGALQQGLEVALSLLKPGGVLAVISFHSLEDRMVKDCFRFHAAGCICPPRQPVCTCGHHADIKLYNKKPLCATAQELEANPRSRSARLRAAIKL